jgi:hypothetical protein
LVVLAVAACRFDAAGPPLEDGRLDRSERDARRERDVAGPQGNESDCLDGIDNDNDGQTDCADPDCAAGYECVERAPASAEGYFRLRKNAAGATVLPCPSGAAALVIAADLASGECTACSCGPLAGAACGYPQIHHWQNSQDCQAGTESDITSKVGKPGCYSGSGSGNHAVKIVGPASVTGAGSCTPSAGALVSPKPWASQIEACAEPRTGGGCQGGSVCVPRAPPGFAAKVCHRLVSGDCGAATAVIGHSDAKDQRACGACACAPGGTSCGGGSYTFYGNTQSCDSGCGSPLKVHPDGKCYPYSAGVTSKPYSVEAEAASAAGGKCTASGGQPTGGIQSTPVTFCCR